MIACPFWQIILPGEHHRLLSGLIIELRPKVVIEINTAAGYSALAIKKFLSPDGNLYSLGIVSMRQFPNYILQESDFVDHRFEQISADLTNPVMFQLIRSYTQMLISFSLMQPKTVFRKNFLLIILHM
jgi:hypothetical protein